MFQVTPVLSKANQSWFRSRKGPDRTQVSCQQDSVQNSLLFMQRRHPHRGLYPSERRNDVLTYYLSFPSVNYVPGSILATSCNDFCNLDSPEVAIPTSQIRILRLESLNDYITIMQTLSRRGGVQSKGFFLQ